MRVEDMDVLIKIMHINTVSAFGECHEAFILLINKQYRATFRYEEDLNRYLEWFKTSLPGRRFILEQAFKISE